MEASDFCPDEVIAQRVRNRIIEQLEWICDPSTSQVSPDEMFECWWDWVVDDNPRRWKDAGLYSPDELKAIEDVNTVLDQNYNYSEICHLSNIKFMETHEFQRIIQVAKPALEIFMIKGKMSEDEIQWVPLDDGS